MTIPNTIRQSGLLLITFLVLFGCARPEQVRHLSADACLILPEKTTKQETLALLGEPDERQALPGGDEQWVYFQANKSFLRETPLIGEKLGSEEYDILTVTFSENLATACSYRLLSGDEFPKGGSSL